MNLGDLTPREPTVKIKRKGGPGRPRLENPLTHVYDQAAKAGTTLEFDLVDTKPETLDYIKRCLTRVARWHGDRRPRVQFDLANNVWHLTVRPNVTEDTEALPDEEPPE